MHAGDQCVPPPDVKRFRLADVAVLLNLAGILLTAGYEFVPAFPLGVLAFAGVTAAYALLIWWARTRSRIAVVIGCCVMGALVLAIVIGAWLHGPMVVPAVLVALSFGWLILVWPSVPYLILLLAIGVSRRDGLQSLLASAGAIACMAFTIPIYHDLMFVHTDPQNGIAFVTVPFFPIVGALSLSFMRLPDMWRCTMQLARWAVTPAERRGPNTAFFYGRYVIEGTDGPGNAQTEGLPDAQRPPQSPTTSRSGWL